MESVWNPSADLSPSASPSLRFEGQNWLYGRWYIEGAKKLTRWQIAFLILPATLCATISWKIASIQYLEYIYFFQIAVIFITFADRGYRITWFRTFLHFGLLYLVFALSAFALALAALRYDFYMPPGLIFLRQPVVITISRLLELFANVSIMLYLANRLRKDPVQARFLLRVYFWTGVASAAYSIVTYPLDVLGFGSYGVYSNLHRARGFYNEGGPYGNYLVSVFVVAWVLYRMHGERTRRVQIGVGLMAIALLMSASKAGLLAIFLILLFNGIFAANFYRRTVMIGAIVVFCLIVSQTSAIQNATVSYRLAGAAYERISLNHQADPNFVNGRVAGIFIVPRMIAAHPLTGIGWGNYSLLRDAPLYRGASAWSAASFAEDHGLGMFGLTAEIGAPLMALLLFILFFPYMLLRGRKVPLCLANLALVQPVVHLAGAQLNSTFPWVVTALALGIAFAVPRAGNDPEPALPVS